MKKKLSVWNAIAAHALVSCVLGWFIAFAVTFAIIYVGGFEQAPFSSSLIRTIFLVNVAAFTLSTWISIRLLHRSDIDRKVDFLNFSTVIVFLVMLSWVDSAVAAMCTVIFYFMTRRAFPAATPIQTVAPAQSDTPKQVL